MPPATSNPAQQTCITCGYELAGLTRQATCPECGTRHARSSPASPRGTPWQCHPSIESWLRTAHLASISPTRTAPHIRPTETPSTLKLNTALAVATALSPAAILTIAFTVYVWHYPVAIILMTVGPIALLIALHRVLLRSGQPLPPSHAGHALFPFVAATLPIPPLMGAATAVLHRPNNQLAYLAPVITITFFTTLAIFITAAVWTARTAAAIARQQPAHHTQSPPASPQTQIHPPA